MSNIGSETLDYSLIDRARWGTFCLQILMGFAVGLTYQLNVWIEPLCATYGWESSTLSWMYTFFGVTGIPGAIIAGKLTERFGVKKTLKIAGIGYAGSAIIAAIPINVWFFNIGMGILVSGFMFIVYIPSLSNICKLFPERQGIAAGFSIACTSIAAAIWAPVVQSLVNVINVSLSIAVEGIITGALVLLMGFLIIEAPEGYRPKGWIPPHIAAVDNGGVGVDDIETVDRNLPWMKLIKTSGFWCLFAMLFFGYIAIRGFHSSLSYIGQQSYGLSESTGALYFSALSIGMVIGSLLYGVCSDKVGPVRTVAIGSAIMIMPLTIGLFFRQCCKTGAFFLLSITWDNTGIIYP